MHWSDFSIFIFLCGGCLISSLDGTKNRNLCKATSVLENRFTYRFGGKATFPSSEGNSRVFVKCRTIAVSQFKQTEFQGSGVRSTRMSSSCCPYYDSDIKAAVQTTFSKLAENYFTDEMSISLIFWMLL